jgi:RNA polymerase sigma factor (sigma-70 family)
MSIAVRNVEREVPRLTPSFEALYADHYDFLWRCALRLGAEPKDVEDIVQEVFMIALRHYDQTEFTSEGARPSTWLFAILHNVLRNHARGERRRRARLEAVAVTEQTRVASDLQAKSSLGQRLLDEFLADLDPDRRAVFVLADLEGMRGPEIAHALGLNPNTVRSRLRGARQAFSACFEHEGEQVVAEAANVAAPAEVRTRGLALLALPGKPWETASGAGVWWRLSSLRGLAALGSVTVAGVVAVVVGVQGQPRESSAREEAGAIVGQSERSPMPTPMPTPIAGEERHDDEAVPIVVEAGQPATKTTQLPAPAKSISSSEALALLERARAAMKEGDAATALALIAGHEGWPTALDAHRVALEIGALCRIGASQRARARAQEWQQTHEGDSTAVSLVPPCWNDDNTSPEGGHPMVKATTSAIEE